VTQHTHLSVFLHRHLTLIVVKFRTDVSKFWHPIRTDLMVMAMVSVASEDNDKTQISLVSYSSLVHLRPLRFLPTFFTFKMHAGSTMTPPPICKAYPHHIPTSGPVPPTAIPAGAPVSP
jgi:hypothetical protein